MKIVVRKYGVKTQVDWDSMNSSKPDYEDIDLGYVEGVSLGFLMKGNKIVLPDKHGVGEIFDVVVDICEDTVIVQCYSTWY